MLFVMLVQKVHNDAVQKACSGVFPEGVSSALLLAVRLDHNGNDAGNIRPFFRGTEVDFCQRIPASTRTIRAERLKLHDLLVEVLLAIP